jgi:RNA polymerase sigma factor (sigma-70 family)
VAIPYNKKISSSDLKKLHSDVYQWALFCSDFDKDLALEVVQQTYLKVLEGSAIYSGNSQIKTWLFSVTRLTCLEIKKKINSRVMLTKKFNADLVNTTEFQTDPVMTGASNSSIASAIDELSLMQREIIYLHFYKGLSLSEIAQTLDTTTGTISSQYDRAKKRLNTLLTNWSSLCETN